MKRFGNIDEIKADLKGKTGFIPEYEEILFEDIREIENGESCVPGTAKIDWIGTLIVTLVCVIIPIGIAVAV